MRVNAAGRENGTHATATERQAAKADLENDHRNLFLLASMRDSQALNVDGNQGPFSNVEGMIQVATSSGCHSRLARIANQLTRIICRRMLRLGITTVCEFPMNRMDRIEGFVCKTCDRELSER